MAEEVEMVAGPRLGVIPVEEAEAVTVEEEAGVAVTVEGVGAPVVVGISLELPGDEVDEEVDDREELQHGHNGK